MGLVTITQRERNGTDSKNVVTERFVKGSISYVRPDVYQRGSARVRRLARPKPTIATFGALLAPAVPALAGQV